MLLHPRHPSAAGLSKGHRAALGALLVAMTATLLLFQAQPAAAHNQRTAFAGVYGPYDIVATVRDVDRPRPGGVQLDLVIRTAADREPVDDATVRVGGGIGGAVVADRYGNVYRVLLPVGTVVSWTASIRVEAEPGVVSLSQVIPGPESLHGGVGGFTGGPSPGAGWLAMVVAGLVVLPLAGISSHWRGAAAVAGAAVLVACAVAVVQAWSRSMDPVPGRVAALLPASFAAALLVAGLVLTQRHRRDAPVLVFAGSAALMAIFGWVNRRVLTSNDGPDLLSPLVGRFTTAAALGLGGGLALLVLVRSRSAVWDLLPGRDHRPSSDNPPRPDRTG